MDKNTLYILLFIVTILKLVNAYTNVYVKTFGVQSNCFDGDSFIPVITSQVSSTTISSCYNSCNNPTTLDPIALLYIGPNETGIKLQVPLDTVTEQYSIVGVEVIYTKTSNTNLQINLNDWTTKEFISPKQSTFIDNYSNFSCDTFDNKFYSSYIYQESLSSISNPIIIKFEKSTMDLATSAIGIRQIKIWTNCKLGCDICTNSTICSTCQLPIQAIGVPSWVFTQKECPHSYGCDSLISNCKLCYTSGSNSSCAECYSNNMLMYDGSCYGGTNFCPANQLYSQGGCENKGTACLIYNRQTKTFNNCDLNKINIENYMCTDSKIAIIYEYNNYSTLQCSCYYLGGYSCMKCIMGQCLKCSYMMYYDQPQNACLPFTCPDGQYATSDLVCHNCFNGCALCTSSTNCTKCTDLAQYPTTTACVPCKISNCLKCDTGGSYCNQCQPGYKNSNCVRSCNITNCEICYSDNTNFCSKCLFGFALNAANNSCIPCTASNCDSCLENSLNQCQSCISNYYLQPDNSCLVCQVNFCQQCLPSQQSQCQTCIANYSINITNLTCETCQVPNCQICSPEDSNQCSQCNTQHFLKSIDNTCEQCPISNCDKCNESNLSQCIQCNNQYYLTSSQTSCIACQVSNCTSCSISSAYKCNTCDPYYYLDLTTFQCIKSCTVSNCQICVTQQNTQCQQCNSRYYLNQVTFQCEPCQVQNCSSCTSQSQYICQTCQNNYILLQGGSVCQVCLVSNCLSCLNNDPNQCFQCANNFYLNPNTLNCEPCQVQNCSKCSTQSQNICQTCQNDFILQLNGSICQHCLVSNCLNCSSNSANQCLECSNNLFPNPITGSCEQCQIQNCNTCSSTNSQVCSECKVNHQLSQIGYCNCNIQNCLQCDDTILNKCLVCNSNFSIDSNFQCQSNCSVKDCQQCALGKSDTCQICNEDKILSFDQKSCILKCLVQNCRECDQQDSTKCEKCMQGYFQDLNFNCQLNNFNQNRGYTKYRLEQKLIDVGIQITIKFEPELVVVPKSDNQVLNLSIINYNQFSYQIASINSNEIVINITFTETVKYQQLKIDFINQQFTNINLIQEKEYQEQLKPYVKLTDQQKQVIASTTAAGQAVSMTVVSSFFPLAIFGHFYILVNTIDYTSFLFYLLYVDIRHPENVISFYGIFRNFQFPFIPNIFYYIIPNDYTLSSPKKFMENGTDAYFLSNGGQSITICIMIFSMYIGARLLQKLPIRCLNQYLNRALKDTWHYSAFFDMLCTVYIYVMVSALVQFYNFDFNYLIGLSIVNYSLHFICTFLAFFIPFAIFIYISKLKNLKSDKEMQVKLSTLVGGLNLYNESDYLNYNTPLNMNLVKDQTTPKIKSFNQIQQQLKEIEKQNLGNDNYSLKIHSSQNIKMPSEVAVNKDNNFNSERNILSPQLQTQEQYDKNNLLSRRTSLIYNNSSFNNLQVPRGRAISGHSRIQSCEGMLLSGKEKQSKLNFINNKKLSDESIIPLDLIQQQNYKNIPIRLKLQVKYSKQYNSLLYIRKIFFSLFIVFLNKSQYAQLVLISLLNIFISFFIFYIRPFEQNSENIKCGVCEILLVCIHICIMFLVSDKKDDDEQTRINCGWVIIAISAVIILWNFIGILFSLLSYSLKLLRQLLLSVYKLKSKVKVTPAKQQTIILSNLEQDHLEIKDNTPQQISQVQIGSLTPHSDKVVEDVQNNIPFSNNQNIANLNIFKPRKSSIFSSFNGLHQAIKYTNTNQDTNTPSPPQNNLNQKRGLHRNSIFQRQKVSKIQRIVYDEITLANSNVHSEIVLPQQKQEEPQFRTQNQLQNLEEFNRE